MRRNAHIQRVQLVRNGRGGITTAIVNAIVNTAMSSISSR